MRTPLASGLTALAFVFVLLGLGFRSWQLVLLALPPLAFLATAALVPPVVPVIRATRTLSRDRIEAGQAFEASVLVVNDGPGLDLVEIRDVLPPEFRLEAGANAAIVPLPAGGSLRLDYAVRPAVKGDYQMGPLRVRALDPLALGYEDAEAGGTSRVVVAPVLEDMRRARLGPRRTRPWFGQVASRQRGIGLEFWGIRDYVPGDDVRRINWKATARLDRLLSNEVEGERSGDVVIVLDARRESVVGSEAENPVEFGVRAALGIADHVLASRNRVGLVVQRDVLDWVYPAFGRRQLYRILDHLVHVRASGEWPFGHVAWVLSRFFPRDCLVVLISPLRDRDALEAVIDLAGRGYDVAVVSPSPLEIERSFAFEGPAEATAHAILRMERENLIAQLRRVAQVVDWNPEVPLAASLRRTGVLPRRA